MLNTVGTIRNIFKTATLTLNRANANPLVNYEHELTSFILENCAINMDGIFCGWDPL